MHSARTRKMVTPWLTAVLDDVEDLLNDEFGASR